MPRPTGSTAKERILARAKAMGGATEDSRSDDHIETTARERIMSRARRMGEVSRAEELAREMAQEEQRRSQEEKTAREGRTSRGRVADIAAFGAGNYGADKHIFGEGYDVGEGLMTGAGVGLTQIAKAGSSAGAWLENLLGDFAREGTNGYWNPDTSKWLFNRWNKSIDEEAEGVRQRHAENTAKGGKAAQTLEDLAAATVAALPQAGAALLTGGASTVSTAEQLAARAAASQGLTGTISRAMQTMAKDPNFRLSFAQVAGPGYEQAKADGADDLRASLYAVGNGLLNAAVEVGGGIQTLPNELAGGTSAWKAWVDSMLDEGKEEVVQGVIERAMQNTMYGKDNPLVGVGNGAVIDPAAAAEEFAGGAVVGGILSGGQIGVQHAMSRVYDARMQERQRRYEQAVAAARERAGVKGTYQASEDGSTSYKGQAAAVDGVDKGGKIRLSSGESVDPADVRFADQDTADVYEGLINADMTADAQTALARAYEGGDGWNYLLGVQESYRAGRYNTDLREDGFAADLTEGQRRLAYELGVARRRADAAESRKNAAPLQSGKLVYEQGVDTSRLSKMQRTSLKLADVLSQTVGGEVHIYSSTQQADGRRTVDQANVAAMLGDAREAPNGFYDHATGNIYLDINAGSNGEGTMLYTLSHEYTHMIRQHAAESFNKLADYLFRQYRENGQDTEALIRAKMDNLGLEYDAAYEEVVADSMESMLTDTNAAEKIAALKKTDRTLWQKLKDLVSRLAASVRKLYADMNPNSEEGRMVRQMGDALERMSDLFAEGLSNVSADGKSEGGTKVSKQARDYSYAALAAKPDMQVTTVDDVVRYDADSKMRKDIIARAIAAAKKVGSTNENGNAVIHVDDTDTDVILSAKGLRHGLDRRFSTNAPVTLKAGEILKNAVRINELTPKKDTVDASYVLIGAAKNAKNEPYIVQFVVNRASNEVTSVDVLYSIGTKTEPAGSLSPEVTGVPATLTGSTISISSLLDYVNRYFPDILPESVLKHYGYTERPSGELGESALFQQRGRSDREILATALESAAQTDWERKMLAEYKDTIGRAETYEQRIAENRAELKELSFAKGKRDTARIQALKTEITKDTNRVKAVDRQLLELEATRSLKDLLAREKEAVKKREEEKRRKAVMEYREDAKERLSVQTYRKRVEVKAAHLMDLVTTNTDKKHVPEGLKEPLARFLSTLRFDSRQSQKGGEPTKRDARYIEALSRLQNVLERQAKYNEGDTTVDGSAFVDLPSGFTEKIEEHIKLAEQAMKGFDSETDFVYNMNAGQLQDLSFILTVLNNSISKANQMAVNRHFAAVDEAAEKTIAELGTLGGASRAVGKVTDFLNWENTLPFYAFRKYGKAGETIFEELQDGWDRLAFNTKAVMDHAESVYTKEEVREWSKKLHTVQLGSGKAVQMTTAQLMSVYALAKRQQAMGHLMGGGIRVEDIKLEKGKGTLKQADPYVLTQEDIANMTAMLSDRQIEVADALQKYMTEQGSAWGNRVSMERFGYRAFTEPVYFPIESEPSNRNAIDPEAKANDMFRLLNLSATKGLTRNANNAIVVRNIFDVFSNHMADMAKYDALALPVLDAMKWYNFKTQTKNETGQVFTQTVQRSIETAFGKGGNNYFTTLIKDINGTKEAGRGEGFWKRAISSYKVAAVGANLRVALLQPTAYVRAGAVIDAKYLAQALTANPAKVKANIQEMQAHSGIGLWKSMGFFDTDIGRGIRAQIKGDISGKEQLAEWSMKAAELGDSITSGAMWNACKLEVQDRQHLTGDALLNAAALRFREVIYRSQVVDGTLTRSHTMRDRSTFKSLATAFMAEPTMSYNMVLDAYDQYAQDARRLGSRKKALERNKGKLTSAFLAYTSSQLAAAVAESIADAFRDDDDYQTFFQKWLEAFWGKDGNLLSDLNLLGKIPGVKDIISIATGWGNDRMDTAWMENMVKAYQAWAETIRLATGKQDKPTDATYNGKMTTYGKIYKTMQGMSQLFGLPVSAAMREGKVLWNNSVGALYPDRKLKTYKGKEESNIQYAYQDGYIDEERAVALLREKAGYTAGEAQLEVMKWESGASGKYTVYLEAVESGENMGAITQKYLSYGVEPKQLSSAITSYFKPIYVTLGPADRATMKGYLLNAYVRLGYDRDKKSKDIDKWLEDK